MKACSEASGKRAGGVLAVRMGKAPAAVRWTAAGASATGGLWVGELSVQVKDTGCP